MEKDKINNRITKPQAAANLNAEALATAASSMVAGIVTGTKVRI
jgi:hypothetical protein